jgi:hypothetical protein
MAMAAIDPRRTVSRFLLPVWLVATMASGANGGWADVARQLLGSAGGAGQATELTADELSAGLKEALRVGTERVVQQLGRLDGFTADAAIRIPLPESLAPAVNVLRKVGLGELLDGLELKLNRAAEDATPKAEALFRNAIAAMTFADVGAIYEGPEDAATQYLRSSMSEGLAAAMRPLVEESLASVGAVQAYENVMARYRALPFAPAADADLTEYVVAKGMDGIFHYVAREEAAIRADPAKRTTELLRRVFGPG